MSDTIIGRVDEMSSRIDELENSIQNLMVQVRDARHADRNRRAGSFICALFRNVFREVNLARKPLLKDANLCRIIGGPHASDENMISHESRVDYLACAAVHNITRVSITVARADIQSLCY